MEQYRNLTSKSFRNSVDKWLDLEILEYLWLMHNFIAIFQIIIRASFCILLTALTVSSLPQFGSDDWAANFQDDVDFDNFQFMPEFDFDGFFKKLDAPETDERGNNLKNSIGDFNET